jgi:hypothetical protein
MPIPRGGETTRQQNQLDVNSIRNPETVFLKNNLYSNNEKLNNSDKKTFEFKY